MNFRHLAHDPVARLAFNRNLGKILKRLRKKKTLNASQVSEKIDLLTPKRLYKFESGRTSIPVNLLFELVKLYEESWFDIEVELAESMESFSAANTANGPLAVPKKEITDHIPAVNDNGAGEPV